MNNAERHNKKEKNEKRIIGNGSVRWISNGCRLH